MNILILETIESIREYVPKLIEAHHKLIQFFREENSLKAFELFPAYTKGLDWMIQAIVLINKQTPFFYVDIDSINHFLNEINAGIRNKDLVLVADILEYEITPFFEEVLTAQRDECSWI